MPASTIQQIVDHLFRHESGKMVSVLSRLLGFQQLDVAQDIVHDTLLQAMTTWPYTGVPENPPAWLYRVARNKAIDLLRRERKFKEISPQYSYLLESEYTLGSTIDGMFAEKSIQDSQLGMIFACCHPAINTESQIALALKTLCGLSTNEIARAFLTAEDTITKRIYRAKEKIRAERIELDLPAPHDLPRRMETVLHCLYLLFNEGYNSSHPDDLIREELCEEAMRLCFLLTQHPVTNLPEAQALLALFCFQASRLKARLDDGGNIILMKYQDRSKWFRPLMNKGFTYLDMAISDQLYISIYHIEAAIASLHASAETFEETDWKGIHSLYEHLYRMHPSPVVALNRAIAKGYAYDKENALEEILAIKGLEKYYLYHTSLGEMCLELGLTAEAEQHYEEAMKWTTSKKELGLLQEKIRKCGRR